MTTFSGWLAPTRDGWTWVAAPSCLDSSTRMLIWTARGSGEPILTSRRVARSPTSRKWCAAPRRVRRRASGSSSCRPASRRTTWRRSRAGRAPVPESARAGQRRSRQPGVDSVHLGSVEQHAAVRARPELGGHPRAVESLATHRRPRRRSRSSGTRRRADLTGRILERHLWPAAEFTILRAAPRFTHEVRLRGLSEAVRRQRGGGDNQRLRGPRRRGRAAQSLQGSPRRGRADRARLPADQPAAVADTRRGGAQCLPIGLTTPAVAASATSG